MMRRSLPLGGLWILQTTYTANLNNTMQYMRMEVQSNNRDPWKGQNQWDDKIYKLSEWVVTSQKQHASYHPSLSLDIVKASHFGHLSGWSLHINPCFLCPQILSRPLSWGPCLPPLSSPLSSFFFSFSSLLHSHGHG